MNTFSEEVSSSVKSPCRLISKQSMTAYSLGEVLEKHISSKQDIDFFPIGVEGLDLEVFQSNNWSKFRPKVILIEQLRSSICQLDNNFIAVFLSEKGYRMYAKTFKPFSALLTNTCLRLYEEQWSQ